MIMYPNHIKKLKKHVSKINYLDIGSRGGLSGWFAEIEDKLNVLSFEASENEGLFNFSGKKNFYLTKNGVTSSFFRPNPIIQIYENQKHRFDYKEIEMKVDTLDNKMKNNDKKIDLIKIDTQGSEFEIIQGGLQTIKKDKPFIFVETWSYPYYEKIKYFDEILSELRKLDYEIYLMEVAASTRLEYKHIFKENFGNKKHTGFNIFLAPSIDEICKISNKEEKIKKSFLFFVHDLLSFSYKIIENSDGEYQKTLKNIIDKRIRYKHFYKFLNYFDFLKSKLIKKNNVFYRLT